MRSNFGNYSRMLETCGLERQGAGFRVGMRTLFLDWAGLARKLGKLPTIREYDANSQFSVMPLVSRFGGWKGRRRRCITLPGKKAWMWSGKMSST